MTPIQDTGLLPVTEEALKPCPFCGGPAVMRQDDDPGFPYYVTFDHAGGCVMYAVPTDLFRSYRTAAEAAEAWNTRAEQPKPFGESKVADLQGHTADAVRDACRIVLKKIVTFDDSEQIAAHIIAHIAALSSIQGAGDEG